MHLYCGQIYTWRDKKREEVAPKWKEILDLVWRMKKNTQHDANQLSKRVNVHRRLTVTSDELEKIRFET